MRARFIVGVFGLLLAGCDDEAGSADVGSDLGDASGDAAPDVVEEVDPGPPGPTARFDPAGDDFFDLPFPSDARRQADGSLGLDQWPFAMDRRIAELWLEAAEDLADGWGLVGGLFVWFDGPIDPETLPADEDASIDTTDGWPSVFLVDVDGDSPDRGDLVPIACQVRVAEGSYHAANQLGCISPYGVVRSPGRQYALVVTRQVRGVDGGRVAASEAMAALLAGQDLTHDGQPVRGQEYVEAAAFLESRGLPPSELAVLALFRTGDPAQRLVQVGEWFAEQPLLEVDEARGLELVDVYDEHIVLQAYTTVPIIQQGERPFSTPPAGRIVFDEQGLPVVQGTQEVRFYVTIPRRPMPEAGFPVMLYFHGSGGNAEELLDRGYIDAAGDDYTPGTGPAAVIAPYGVAGFSADFQFHGMRGDPPDETGLVLYNVTNNPRALVDNFIVGACETTRYSRLLESLTIDPAVAPDYLDPGDAEDGLIRFDGTRMSAFGHSMGATIGLPASTIDPRIDRLVLSGSGGVVIEIVLATTSPIDLNDAFRQLMSYRVDETLDRFEPLLSAWQMAYDFNDPVVHARRVYFEPYAGMGRKHVLQPSGLDDHYFSPASRAGLATALRADLVEPVLEPVALNLMRWTGHGEALPLPVAGNGLGGTTAVSAQYERDQIHGHFVLFQRDDAKAQYGCFVGSPDRPELRAPDLADPADCLPSEE